MQDLEDEDQNQLPARRWSPFMQTDPVALQNGKVITGKGEFAAEYASMVFLFETEQNLKLFVATPRKYLCEKPRMPTTYNIALLGPHAAGKRTMAKLLAERYGWTIVDLDEIVETVARR